MSTGEARQRWRLVLARAAGPSAQRDVERAWEAAVRDSGLPWAPAAARDVPRIAFGAPLPVGVAGDAELVDLFLARRLPMVAVREALGPVLPLGDRIVDLYDVWLGEPGLPSLVVGADYRLTISEPSSDQQATAQAVARMNAAVTIEVERRKGDRVRTVDLRRLIDELAVELGADGGLVLTMRLRHDPDLGNGRPEDVLGALQAFGAPRMDPVTIVRERLRLAGSI
jgi:radical SAM-linked protein